MGGGCVCHISSRVKSAQHIVLCACEWIRDHLKGNSQCNICIWVPRRLRAQQAPFVEVSRDTRHRIIQSLPCGVRHAVDQHRREDAHVNVANARDVVARKLVALVSGLGQHARRHNEDRTLHVTHKQEEIFGRPIPCGPKVLEERIDFFVVERGVDVDHHALQLDVSESCVRRSTLRRRTGCCPCRCRCRCLMVRLKHNCFSLHIVETHTRRLDCVNESLHARANVEIVQRLRQLLALPHGSREREGVTHGSQWECNNQNMRGLDQL